VCVGNRSRRARGQRKKITSWEFNFAQRG
jgi:hypothetical protein